ncbi:hypothetical protein JTB14_003607 [Gonioctena quinquepunctata]|nr:hypothetical protein JTB14_003607 [Gonioctena quinquepunctata]
MEIQVSPTPEETITSDIEREALRKTQRTTGHATQSKSLMGKTIKLIQANLQHAKVASYAISKIFANELLDVALIQEPYTIGPSRINGLAIFLVR